MLSRFYLFSGLLLLFGLALWAKLVYLSLYQREVYQKKPAQRHIKTASVPASRGNVYTEEGDLMATTLTKYDVRMDLMTVDKRLFKRAYKALADSLAALPNSPAAPHYRARLLENYRRGNRYLLLKRGLDYPSYKRVCSFPILKRGRFKGGLISVRKSARVHPMGDLAARTLGFDDYRGRVGLEGAYGCYLRGRAGKRLEQKIAPGIWKPLNDADEIEPEDGDDLITTLDLGMQEVAYQVLLETLKKFKADHGCLVVMEVKTAAIKAIANLGRGEEGSFYEKRNYALYESSEPGSVFKLVSLMAALEDHVIDTTTQVDTQGGIMRYYDNYIRDSHRGGYGVITAKKVLEVSSNVGAAKLILQHYKDHPERFVNRLYKWGLNEKLHLVIPGEGSPHIPHPDDPNWSGISLPWIAYGYGLRITPLQLLTFYNAVANGGKMLKPLFVKKILRQGHVKKAFKAQVLNPTICSKETLGKVRAMLKGVFLEGTAEYLHTDAFSMAGKTGTVQLGYWRKDQAVQYRSSFCGYFPAEKPEYSCIVVVDKPDKHLGYYGAQVAAPAFRKIAHYVYVSHPKDRPEALTTHGELSLKAFEHPIRFKGHDRMPNLLQRPGMQAVSQLENRGLKVRYQGVGKVLAQYPKAGSPLSTHTTIRLRLQS